MTDAFNIMQDRITRARLAGDPPDLLISPRVGQIGWFDFHRANDLIAHGTRAADRAIEAIVEAIEILAPKSAAETRRARTLRASPILDIIPYSGGLDVVAQRFLLGLVFLNTQLDDVADRNQTDQPAVLHHRQMPEFFRRHDFHEVGDRIRQTATDDLAGHGGADRLVERTCAAFVKRTDDVTLGQNAVDARTAHDEDGTDLPFRKIFTAAASFTSGSTLAIW